jgi:small subunit ribosomal protein S20
VARSLSSQKRQRQNVKCAARNKARKTTIKSKVRKVRDTIQARDAATAETMFRQAVKELDQNANRRTIHPNTAARRKSRLARQLNALKAGARK